MRKELTHFRISRISAENKETFSNERRISFGSGLANSSLRYLSSQRRKSQDPPSWKTVMKWTFKRLVRFASQFAVFALFAAPLLAQEQTSAVWHGWLRNSAGAPIAGAKVQLVGTVNKTATTGSNGEFLFISLSEGQYH